MKQIVFLFFFVPFIACNEDIVLHQINDQGVVIATPYLWKTSLHKKEPVSFGFIKKAIYYNNGVLIPRTNGEYNSFSWIDVDNGIVKWDWSDEFSPKRYGMYISYYHQYSNLLMIQDGSRSYCLNLDKGTTQWKYLRPSSSLIVFQSGINETFFIHGQPISHLQEYVATITFKGDMLTGDIEEFITPNFILSIAPGNRIGDVTTTLYDELNGQPYLIIIWQEPIDFWKWQTYLGLYDYKTNEWIYEKEVMNEPALNGVLFPPSKIHNGKVYANVGCSIVCHDIATGKQLWKRDFSNDFMFSGFIIEDGRLIANNEDLFTVCLNPDTGNELWRVKTAGTSSLMSYLNGIVYFAGGSESKLFAVEASTGKIVWKINAALLGEGEGAQFRYNAVYVLPAKDNQPAKVIALSNLYAYCFKAYR